MTTETVDILSVAPGAERAIAGMAEREARRGKRAGAGKVRPPEEEGRGFANVAFRRGPRSPQYVGKLCAGGVQYTVSVWVRPGRGGRKWLAFMLDEAENGRRKAREAAAAEAERSAGEDLAGDGPVVGGLVDGAYVGVASVGDGN